MPSEKSACAKKKTLLMFLVIVILAVLAVMLVVEYGRKQKFRKDADKLNEKYLYEQNEKDNERKKQEETSNFYEKIKNGFDVNILIVGDAIENSNGVSTSWRQLLDRYIEDNYFVTVGMTNVSMEGNSSYAGYSCVMNLDDGIDYDLAIICYGHYDDDEQFDLYYESIVRAIGQKYKNCCVVSVLESAQQTYTDKMKTIQTIAAHYGISVADTIEAFNSGRYGEKGEVSELTDDRIHPNDLGQEVYFEVIRDAIIGGSNENRMLNDTAPMNGSLKSFETFRYIGVDDFERVDDFTFEIETRAQGEIVGIDYHLLNGENKVEVYADGKLFAEVPVSWDNSYAQRRMMIIGNDFNASNVIKLVFSTKEEAENFGGLILSGFTEEVPVPADATKAAEE